MALFYWQTIYVFFFGGKVNPFIINQKARNISLVMMRSRSASSMGWRRLRNESIADSKSENIAIVPQADINLGTNLVLYSNQ